MSPINKLQVPVGSIYGKLTVIGDAPSRNWKTYWLCRCSCGSIKEIRSNGLRSGNTKSCGCLSEEIRHKRRFIITETDKRLARIRTNMISRCYNKKVFSYRYYGAKGITVCKSWRKSFIAFKKWALSNGYSNELTLDRIRGNKSYTPSNCRWATRREQSINKKSCVTVRYKGKKYKLPHLADMAGIDSNHLYIRIFTLGWSVEEAADTPIVKGQKIKKPKK